MGEKSDEATASWSEKPESRAKILTLVVLSIGGVQGTMPTGETGPLRLLRLLRLSRLVRLLREMPELLTLINGMRVAARAVSSALLLVILLNYVFAIVLLMFLADIPEVTEARRSKAIDSILGDPDCTKGGI
ncbi:unnamed protein product [Effrenium voratum]|nr:unnamed protein product [Effrenium voratum]